MDRTAQFAKSRRAAVVAAAGCGKTNLIAQAVAGYSGGRELILTHTHAGVQAIRARLSQFKVKPSTYHVDTIAGWALAYAASYPGLSGLTNFMPQDRNDWDSVYSAASKLLDNTSIKKVVPASYSGMYVDEYQDCLVLQHELILKLAELLPCRIVGDPLQSIFGFGGNEIVAWDKEVRPAFEQLYELVEPWRWKDASPELGRWLYHVREVLLRGEDIDLRQAPRPFVTRGDSSVYSNRQNACRRFANFQNESVCAILPLEIQCFNFARQSGGMYRGMEAMECKDLYTWASRFEECTGSDRACAVRDFGSDCFTGVGTILQDMKSFLAPNARKRNPDLKRISSLLQTVAAEPSLSCVLPALEQMRHLSDVRLFRSELYNEVLRAFREYSTGKYHTLRDAAWQVRDRTRRFGRRLDQRIVSRTLLIKGLEFNHAIILDADALDTTNLYVAMTRGSHSLTVLSKGPILNPAKRKAAAKSSAKYGNI